MKAFKYITIHCSATQCLKSITADTIRKWHTDPKPQGRGWSDIGYHFVILSGGGVQVGRPLTRDGAGVRHHNKDNLHICMIGGVDSKGKAVNNFNPIQFEALRHLVDELAGRYAIPLANVKGHRDWSPDLNKDGVIDSSEWLKDCPCFDVRKFFKGD